MIKVTPASLFIHAMFRDFFLKYLCGVLGFPGWLMIDAMGLSKVLCFQNSMSQV